MSSDPQHTDHWLVRPGTVRRLWRVLYAVLALTVLAQFLIPIKGYFGLDGWFGFAAVFGFLSCVAMVGVSYVLGAVLKRPDDYYEAGRGPGGGGSPVGGRDSSESPDA